MTRSEAHDLADELGECFPTMAPELAARVAVLLEPYSAEAARAAITRHVRTVGPHVQVNKLFDEIDAIERRKSPRPRSATGQKRMEAEDRAARESLARVDRLLDMSDEALLALKQRTLIRLRGKWGKDDAWLFSNRDAKRSLWLRTAMVQTLEEEQLTTA